MEFLVIWLTFGFIAGYIYQRRGRSQVVGFIAGFLLGPIGVVLALISSSQLPTCPFCAENVKKEALVCKHCGRDLPPGLHAPMKTGIEKWKAPLAVGAILIGLAILFYLYTIWSFGIIG